MSNFTEISRKSKKRKIKERIYSEDIKKEIISEIKEVENLKDKLNNAYIVLRIFAAFDQYLHKIMNYSIREIFDKSIQSGDNYKKLKIPIDEVKKGVEDPDDENWLKEALNKEYEKTSYLSLRSLKWQLGIIFKKPKEKIKEVFNNLKEKDNRFSKNKYKRYQELRNDLAHKNHNFLEVRSKIDKDFFLEYFKNFVECFHRVISSSNKYKKENYC